jgi:hypothetical protein
VSRRLLLVLLALAVVASLLGCGPSLSMDDVDATMERLSEEFSAGRGVDETYEALRGTAITDDFAVVVDAEPIESRAAMFELRQLQALPELLDIVREDDASSMEIEGNTLVITGQTGRLLIDFERSGDIFLIKRIADG